MLAFVEDECPLVDKQNQMVHYIYRKMETTACFLARNVVIQAMDIVDTLSSVVGGWYAVSVLVLRAEAVCFQSLALRFAVTGGL